MRPVQKISLGKYAWHFRAIDEQSSIPCDLFPTVVHHELRVIGKIPDEGIAFNERALQWVGETDWLFSTTFPTPKEVAEHAQLELVFDGLDTLATVSLNGKEILKCDNMFVPERVDVRDRLIEDGNNVLEILFDSAARVAREREGEYGAKFLNLRESSRMYVRKAQFQWGWDWGPAMITCGPFKDIRLEMSGPKLVDLFVKSKLSHDFKTAELTFQIEVDKSIDGMELRCKLKTPVSDDGDEAETVVWTQYDQRVYIASTSIQDPQLWWPVRQGKQNRYEVFVSLTSNGTVMDSRSTRFGIRHVELIQYPLKSDSGTTFYFRINGRPVFCTGTNWVPCHNFFPCITPQLYHEWIDLAVQNNNNMIRVWGGGWYEGDDFYDYCDEKGILIWHDMMFACGIYPLTDSFHASVRREIAAQVKRLRNHPCITLYCGDNEFYFMCDRQNEPYDPEETKNFTKYPERKLYFDTIPQVLEKEHSEVPYWPSSPFGGNPANSSKHGDVHQWDVWHGAQLHYQEYPKLGGRFVSEYGLHGFPDIRTVEYFAPDPKTRYPNSRVMDVHNKSSGAESKLGKYLSANFRVNWYNMEDYIYASQLMQCEALSYANRAWRRCWMGPGREACGGIIIWQLNDIYPVTSWSTVDSFFRKKPAFFTTKRDFAPICIGISRTPVWLFVPEDKRREHKTNIPTFEVYASSFLLEDKVVELHLMMYDWNTHSKIAMGHHTSKSYILDANSATELVTITCPDSVTEDSLIILAAILYEPETGKEISRHFSWPEPYRYLLSRNDTEVETQVLRDSVVLSCGKVPIKGLLAYVDSKDGEEAQWEDNMYDLMPGEEIILAVKGLDGRQVKTRWMYSWEEKDYLH